MNQNAFAPIALLIVGALSGCFGGAHPAAAKEFPAGDGLNDAVAAAADLGPIVAVPVKAWYRDSGTGASSGNWGGTSATDRNKAYFTGIVNLTGTIQGDAPYVWRNADLKPGHLYDGTKTWSFTGSVPGCGSGSITFAGPAFAAVDSEGARVNVTMKMVPGTTSTGLSGIVDAILYSDSHNTFPQAVPVTGTIWCRSTPAPSREGARAIPISAWYDDGGAGMAVGPEMTNPFGMVNFTGGIRGNGAWYAKISPPTGNHVLDFVKDPIKFVGSIPGCGSGAMAMLGKGFFRMDAPGGLHTNLTMRLVPGSTSTGLAGVVDVQLYLETYDWPQNMKAPIKGTIWCKEPTPVNREGARELAVKAWLDDSITGMGAVSGSGYVTEVVNATGGLMGDFAVVMHNTAQDDAPGYVPASTDKDWTFAGSIPGCGSGTVSFVTNRLHVKPDTKGFNVAGTFQMVQGSTSTGLAGMVDAVFKLDTYDYPQAKPMIEGKIWCK